VNGEIEAKPSGQERPAEGHSLFTLGSMPLPPATTLAQVGSAASGEPLVEIRGVAKRFGLVEVLHRISLDVAEGEFLTILGASGSGKTTLLRLVAGFERPDEGEIRMAGRRLDTLPPYHRRVNTVFQHYALFPHLSVFENVAYGLRVQKVGRGEIPERVNAALAMVKMSEFAARAPRQLSGGQQQRVALARALVNRPALLLLDEPLSALDANLRRQMQMELKSLQREVGISFLYVTHDQEEAMALSDRIALLGAGELEQVATPREIYTRPVSAYTAQFIGLTNLLRGRVDEGWARCGSIGWRCAAEGVEQGRATFSLRPENIRLCAWARETPSPEGLTEIIPPASRPEAPDDTVRFRAMIRHQIFGGATDLLEITCPDGQALLARIPSRGHLEGEHDFEFYASDAVRVRDEM
jgi:spermidine/putrescine transport system ATP-binding protein